MNCMKHPMGVKDKRRLLKPAAILTLTSALLLASGLNSMAGVLPASATNSNINAARKFASITGKVVDEAGQPLPGVTIRVKGTQTAAATNAEGTFVINAPADATLVVSFLGYQTQEVAVAGKNTLTISLVPANKALKELVVTALGIRKEERKLGYSVTTVNGNTLDKAKETNVAYSLEGKVAGLNIAPTSGGPGSSARILLRGLTSQSATGPLFVINGIPMDNTQRGQSGEWGGADYGDGISNINPDDIESLTVLKGQAASALYGTRAVNGVILITTKSGKKNSGFGVEYNTNYQFDKAIDYTNFQKVYGQGLNGVKPGSVTEALNTGSLAWGAKLDGSPVLQIDGQTHPYSNVSNYKDFYRTGGSFTNTVTLTGGGDNGSFRLSASDLNNRSIVPNSGLERKTFNFNATQAVTKRLEVTAIANYVLDKGRNRSSLSDGPGNPNNALFLAPNQDVHTLAPGYDASGHETSFTNDIYVTNPYFAAYKFSSITNRERLITTLSAKYTLNDWIYALGRIGYDKIHDTRTDITPTGTAYNTNNGGMTVTKTDITEFNPEVLVNGKHDIVKDFLNLDLTIGGTIRKSNYNSSFIQANNFIIPYFYDLSNGQTRNSGNNQPSALQVNSLYYTADLALKDYLVLSTTGRYDYYSSILKSVGPGIFAPSVSGSFIFSDLLHMQNVDIGKIRLGYSKTSNTANPYANTVYYSVANSINGTSAASFSNTLPNLLLKPFTLREFEAGAEMKFFKDRFGFDVTYFTRKTKDEILGGSLDISTGYNSYFVATGSTQNKGLEVELHGSPVRGTFNWNPSFNFTYVTNKILATDASNSNVGLGTYRPLNATTAFVAGKSGPQILANDYVRNANGQIVFNADGTPQQGARTPQGSVLPKFYGGFNNDFSYKRFNLSFLVDYKYGNKVLSATSYYSIYRGENQITLAGREGGVVGQGVTASGAPNTVNVPAQTYYQNLAQNISALNVLNGQFIKLRQVTFGYTIPSTLLRGTPLYSITVSAVARNLWTIMKRSDNIDPESNFAPGINYAGIEGTSLPSVRTLGFNVNFKFNNK